MKTSIGNGTIDAFYSKFGVCKYINTAMVKDGNCKRKVRRDKTKHMQMQFINQDNQEKVNQKMNCNHELNNSQWVE